MIDRFAGEVFSDGLFDPFDVRDGLENMPKRGLRRAFYDSYRAPTKIRGTGSVMNLYDVRDPYAPERSQPGYALRGSVQPPETYGL